MCIQTRLAALLETLTHPALMDEAFLVRCLSNYLAIGLSANDNPNIHNPKWARADAEYRILAGKIPGDNVVRVLSVDQKNLPDQVRMTQGEESREYGIRYPDRVTRRGSFCLRCGDTTLDCAHAAYFFDPITDLSLEDEEHMQWVLNHLEDLIPDGDEDTGHFPEGMPTDDIWPPDEEKVDGREGMALRIAMLALRFRRFRGRTGNEFPEHV